jgi:hypothetical protein
MSDVVGEIQAAFCELAAALPEVATAVDYEPGPEGLPRLPAVTMLYLGPLRTGQSTGNVEDLEHTWEILVYVDLKTSKLAQEQSRNVVAALKVAVKNDYRLGDSCDMAHLLDQLARPEFQVYEGTKGGELLKRLRLTARRESF